MKGNIYPYGRTFTKIPIYVVKGVFPGGGVGMGGVVFGSLY